jgi:hypothetical protein
MDSIGSHESPFIRFSSALRNVCHENSGYILLGVISSIAALFLFPGAVLPLVLMTVTFVGMKVVTVLNQRENALVNDLTHKANEINKKYPKIQAACILVPIILSYLSSTMSLFSAGVAGIYLGMTVESYALTNESSYNRIGRFY